MDKEEILDLLAQYDPEDTQEIVCKEKLIHFLMENDIFWGKSNTNGHITGSAWVVNKDRSKVLLTHHRKLNKWIQLGGHTDEGERIRDTALREAREESGLSTLKLLSGKIFDIHLGEVPAWGNDKAHIHYDIRFILEANDREAIQITAESKDLQWVPLDRVKEYNRSHSILRMVKKTKAL